MSGLAAEPLTREPGDGGYGLRCSADPLGDLRRLRPLIEGRAAGSERDAWLDDEVVAALVSAGTLTLMVPASMGGGEADPSVQLDDKAGRSWRR